MKITWPRALVVALCAGVALLIYLDSGPRPPQWSSTSEEAIRELEEGLADRDRRYWADAIVHFQRALELDPDFAMAKLQWARTLFYSDTERNEELWQQLEAIPEGSLSDRESLFLSYSLARRDKRFLDARSMLDAYLATLDEPDRDPYALKLLCNEEWETRHWQAARDCYTRLLRSHPNQVQAQSRLGQIAMAEGDFEQADESFRKFVYIAPDQADPHDALGQLLAVRGRYEEAEACFFRALEVKEDFCGAISHLQGLYSMWGRPDRALEMIERGESLEGCAIFNDFAMSCGARAWNAFDSGDPEAAEAILNDGCLERRGGADLLAHRLAVEKGDMERALAMEAVVEGWIEAKSDSQFQGRKSYLESLLPHLRGVRELSEGRIKTACEELQASDDQALYWGMVRSMLKLYNQAHLVRCYEESGHPTAALAAKERIDAVNPRFLNEVSTVQVGKQHR